MFLNSKLKYIAKWACCLAKLWNYRRQIAYL